jgi:hypothetical protein
MGDGRETARRWREDTWKGEEQEGWRENNKVILINGVGVCIKKELYGTIAFEVHITFTRGAAAAFVVVFI